MSHQPRADTEDYAGMKKNEAQANHEKPHHIAAKCILIRLGKDSGTRFLHKTAPTDGRILDSVLSPVLHFLQSPSGRYRRLLIKVSCARHGRSNRNCVSPNLYRHPQYFHTHSHCHIHRPKQ